MAVWVGMIALAGLYAETAIVMLLYIDLAVDDYRAGNRLTGRGALVEAIRGAAAKRLRPVLMTIATDAVGLLPIMWSVGIGADVMKRIATPLVGGVVTTGIVVLVLLPVVYSVWKGRGLPRGAPSVSGLKSGPRPRESAGR